MTTEKVREAVTGGISNAIARTWSGKASVNGWFYPVPTAVTLEVKRHDGEVLHIAAETGVFRRDLKQPGASHAGWKASFDIDSIDFEAPHFVIAEVDGLPEKRKLVFNLIDDRPVIEAHLAKYRRIDKPYSWASPAITALMTETFAPELYVFDRDEFARWRAEVDYDRNYPKYVDDFHYCIEAKAREHYLSALMANMAAGGIFMDGAASQSPFDHLTERLYGTKTYRQDLNYPAGVHGMTVGSNAQSIPLPDGSLDGIVSHNAWEHFEGESRNGFIKESMRLLKPGGIMCILPIVCSEHTHVLTSPSCWFTKYINDHELPGFDPRAAIYVDEPAQQRQVMIMSPGDLKDDLDQIPNMDFRVLDVRDETGRHVMYAMTGTRRG